MNSLHAHVFCIQAFDSVIRVECPGSKIQQIFNRYLFPPLQRIEPAASADLIVHAEEAPNEIRVLLNQELIASTVTAEDAALATVKALDDAVVHQLKDLYAIHAGAVLIDGRAVLLPGSTHAGKSSFVAELLRRGAKCLSDEYALIDSEGRVHSYPRPLLLRKGQPKQSLVLPEDLNSSYATETVPVGWIFATDFKSGGEWDIRTVSQSEAVMLLLRNTPHEMAQAPKIIDYFQRVAADAACYEGCRGEVGEAATRLLESIHRK
jgi:hypothetical protein